MIMHQNNNNNDKKYFFSFLFIFDSEQNNKSNKYSRNQERNKKKVVDFALTSFWRILSCSDCAPVEGANTICSAVSNQADMAVSADCICCWKDKAVSRRS